MVFIEPWKKEQHLRRFFSYVPYKNDVAGEGIDAETNKHLKEKLGVSLTIRKKLPISFEELKLEEMIPRETLEKMFKDADSLLSNSCLKWRQSSNSEKNKLKLSANCSP